MVCFVCAFLLFYGSWREQVRTAEENIRHCMQIWIDKKHKHKKHLRKALQELQNLPVLKDEHIEVRNLAEHVVSVLLVSGLVSRSLIARQNALQERTAYLRQCIDELTNESTYVKMCISFWEEILRHRRLEAISKGLSYLSWANKDNASHPNADRTLVALHEQLNALRQVSGCLLLRSGTTRLYCSLVVPRILCHCFTPFSPLHPRRESDLCVN